MDESSWSTVSWGMKSWPIRFITCWSSDLLVVGFYLINIGYVTLALKYGVRAASLQEGLEILSTKVGLVLLVLGLMHFFNLFVFTRMRRRALNHRPPPLYPLQVPTMNPVK